MSKVHGKNTYVSLNAVDLSTFCNSVEFAREADAHETTGFGQNSKSYAGGLKDGTVKLQGVYDSDAAGPKATIEALLGTVVDLIHRPEGTGAAKPERTCEVLVKTYTETAPVADMVTWQADLQISGDVSDAAQV